MKNVLVVDLDRCSGCDSCVAACKHAHKIDLGVYRNHVSAIGPMGTYPNVSMYWLPMQCMQCDNPGCIAVCPTGASYRDSETGVVLINVDICIGCQSCMTGCPYGVRSVNPNTQTIDKCTLCFEDRVEGEDWEPACVHNCCTGARIFGDLDDPESDVSKAIAAAGENVYKVNDINGVGPNGCFILSPKTAEWQEWTGPEVEVKRYEKM